MTGTRALAAVVLIGLSSTAAANPDFDRGKTLLENLEYKAAAEAFEKALERGENDAATTAAIHLHLGEISASTGDTQEAIEHFKRALSIDLSIKLAKGTSPKVGKPFADARRGIDDPISARVEVDSGDTVAATLEIANDSLEMIHAAAVTYIAGDKKTTAELKISGGKTQIPMPAGATGLEITLLDRYENRLIVLEPVTLATGPASDEEDDDDDGGPSGPELGGEVTKKTPSRPFITRWYLWGGLAVAAAANGAGFGFSTQSTLEKLDELKMSSTTVEGSEALALEDKARSRALFANISFAAAGAFAIAAGVFFFTGGGDDDGGQDSLSLTPALGPDQVGVVSTVRW